VAILYVLILEYRQNFAGIGIESPEFQKTGFGIAGIGNTNWNTSRHMSQTGLQAGWL
jgi:hypothetical protein